MNEIHTSTAVSTIQIQTSREALLSLTSEKPINQRIRHVKKCCVSTEYLRALFVDSLETPTGTYQVKKEEPIIKKR